MSACSETRVAAFRLFVADLFFTTNQVSAIALGTLIALNPTVAQCMLFYIAVVGQTVS